MDVILLGTNMAKTVYYVSQEGEILQCNLLGSGFSGSPAKLGVWGRPLEGAVEICSADSR